MNNGRADGCDSANLGRSSAPDSISVFARGFAAEDEARRLATIVGECVHAFGRRYDLSRLDGVTVAGDYAQALLELDRGYETSHRLMASEGPAVGIAMTPSVLRDGTLKSHMLFNAHYVAPIADVEHEFFSGALHTIAHECAHVEITSKFDRAFPGVLLQQRHTDPRVAFRWQVILACWDEYAATSLSAGVGEDPTDNYEEVFLKHLVEARPLANKHIRRYRSHGDVDQVFAEVYGQYGDLLKFAAYHLGNLNGQGIPVSARPRTVDALADHWFAPYFARLDDVCQRIARDYGSWTDRVSFEGLGDIADDLVALGGIQSRYLESGELYLDIPFTHETMPGDQ